MIFGIVAVRKRFGYKVSLIWILVTAAIPCAMEYSVQMRMYTWCMLFATLAAWYAFSAWERNRIRDYVILGLSSVACAYLQYFAFVSVLWILGILFLFLVFGKKWKQLLRWGIMGIACVLLYLPWIPFWITQIQGVSEAYWIPAITKRVVLGYADWFCESKYPAIKEIWFVLFAVCLIVGLLNGIRAIRKKTDRTEYVVAWLAILLIVLQIATGVVLSKIIRPIYIIRYSITLVPIMCLGFAIFAAKLDRIVLGLYICTVICLLGVSYKETYDEEYHSTDTKKTIQFLRANVGENDIVVYNYALFGFIYGCYDEMQPLVYIDQVDFENYYDDIWFMNTVWNPQFSQTELDNYGLSYEYVGDYGIEHNPFGMYHIFGKSMMDDESR